MSTVTVDQRASLSGWRSYLSELWRRREFAWFLATGNLTARNASTSLGMLWWVLNPLIMSAVYFLVFGLIFDASRRDPAFLSWLLSGMFVFNFTSTAMTTGANAILSNSSLLVNIRFPRMILPLSAMIESGIGFLASLGIFYFIAYPANQIGPGRWIWLLLIAVVIQSVLNLGLAAATARLAVPFRDINNLLPHLSRLWLYLSPVIWSLSFIEDKPQWAQTALSVNPLYGVLGLYRTALLGREFEWLHLWSSLGWMVVIGGFGIASFVRYEGNMVRHL